MGIPEHLTLKDGEKFGLYLVGSEAYLTRMASSDQIREILELLPNLRWVDGHFLVTRELA